MRTRIKICGITRLEDALSASALGVDALGFVFVERSPRHVTVDQAKKLIQKLPAFVSVVGLFMDADTDTVSEVCEKLPLDVLQFHGAESPSFCTQFDRPYIKAIPMGGGANPVEESQAHSTAKAVLLDSNALGEIGGSGHVFDWEQIPSGLIQPLVLAGGLTVQNVRSAVTGARPYAVDVSSGVEVAKGLKDPAKMAAFVQEVQKGDEINAKHS